MSGTDFSLLMKGFCLTYGDSSAMIEKTGKILLITKEMLLDEITYYQGTLDEYMSEIQKQYNYIEVQLWCDDLISGRV